MSDFLWSVKVSRRLPRWEAWVERDGRMIQYTFDFAWTENAARRKSRKRFGRWKNMHSGGDIPGTKRGEPA